MSANVATLFPEAPEGRTKLDAADEIVLNKPRVDSDASSTVTVACPDQTAWMAKESHGDISHQIISSYFIGPQAENLPYFEKNIHTILEELRLARTRYFPEDGVMFSKQTNINERD
jgi:hypothetical protein